MRWFRNATRLSAILSVIVGALNVTGGVVAIPLGMMDIEAATLAVGGFIPLVSGIIALRGPRSELLLLAWGWVLGVELSALLESLPKRLPNIPVKADVAFVFGPDYTDAVLVAIALAGLALYLIGMHEPREN